MGFGVQPKGSKLLLPSVSRAGLQLSVSVPRLTNCARATAATQPRMANLETEAIVCCVCEYSRATLLLLSIGIKSAKKSSGCLPLGKQRE